MPEDILELSKELIEKNAAEVGPGGQGKIRGVPTADAGRYNPTRPETAVNIRTMEEEKVLLSPPDSLPFERLTLEDKLGRTKFITREGDPHLIVDNEICQKCPGQWCLVVCPTQRYSKDAEGKIHVDYEGCVECGTCRVACLPGGVYWKYPLGGFGVSYRQG